MKLDLEEEVKNEYNNTSKEDLNEFLKLLGKNVRFYSRVSGDIMKELVLEKIRKYSDEFYNNTTNTNINNSDLKKVGAWFELEKRCNRDTFLKDLLDKELIKFKNFLRYNKKIKKIKK